MTIYIVEIPHRGPAHCWTAHDRDDVTSRIASDAVGSDAVIDTYEQAIDYLRSDLRSMHVYESAEKARDALTRPIWSEGGRSALASELDDEPISTVVDRS